jgi:hypothetical protein
MSPMGRPLATLSTLLVTGIFTGFQYVCPQLLRSLERLQPWCGIGGV